MEYVKAIAHMQTSKFQHNGDIDSDSDSEIENPETVDNEASQVDAADEETDTASSTNQRDITCRICLDNACDAILLPCGHASCPENALSSQKITRWCCFQFHFCNSREFGLMDKNESSYEKLNYCPKQSC